MLKSARLTELVAAVRSAAAGHPVFTPELAGLVLGEYRRLAGRARHESAGERGPTRSGAPAGTPA